MEGKASLSDLEPSTLRGLVDQGVPLKHPVALTLVYEYWCTSTGISASASATSTTSLTRTTSSATGSISSTSCTSTTSLVQQRRRHP